MAPWKSVDQINLLTDTDVTFLLTSGGRNAGIISEPIHGARHYRVGTKHEGEPFVASEEWFEICEEIEGSWWPTRHAWPAQCSSNPITRPAMGSTEAGCAPLGDAPGTYVLDE